MESINIRLDKISKFPVSKFPDISEKQKAWIREEIYWSKQIQLHNLVLREKGKIAALNMFDDGAGYFLSAKTWVPFLPANKAFILYLCWEQKNLRGSDVTLEKLEDSFAKATIRPIYFDLYTKTAHIKQQISLDSYRKIFNHLWQDRASSAGWKLKIEYANDSRCVFYFSNF